MMQIGVALTQHLQNLNLQNSVTELPGVGSSTKEKLGRLGIQTIQDLLFQLPLKYQDRTKIIPIINSTIHDEVQIEGKITSSKIIFRGRRNLICEIEDKSSSLTIRFINFNLSQKKQLEVGKFARCFGNIRFTEKKKLEMIHPEYTIFDKDKAPPLPESLSPIYSLTSGISQKMLIKLKKYALVTLAACKEHELELFPTDFRKTLQLKSIKKTLLAIHFPDPKLGSLTIQSLKKSLAFEELLAQQLYITKLKAALAKKRSVAIEAGQLRDRFIKLLDFSLTESQSTVLEEIDLDLKSGTPMQRIIQGDVGSGKTVVAAAVAVNLIEKGYKVALMAPTELLAEQHFKTFRDWFNKLDIETYLLLGKTDKKNRENIYSLLKSHKPMLVIGTHTLFQDSLTIKNLGLSIIDEQHRFGVQQRKKLEKKGWINDWQNHMLMMSATPIPRTLSLTIFGALKISTINKVPSSRKNIITSIIHEQRRQEVIDRIDKIFKQGQQVFWVCPLIQADINVQRKAATSIAADLAKQLGKSKIGLIHGKLENSEKEKIMKSFIDKEIDVLVATTVIEVGIDVPNATLMIIDGPENMGLAQLHQLRGRVGRGNKQGFCILLYGKNLSENGKKKLKILRNSTDGFHIAEQDLEIRGPGQLLGKQQSGLPNYKIADLVKDGCLLEKAIKICNSESFGDEDIKIKLIERWRPEQLEIDSF